MKVSSGRTHNDRKHKIALADSISRIYQDVKDILSVL